MHETQANQTVSAAGVHVAGRMQGWDPAGTAMSDAEDNVVGFVQASNPKTEPVKEEKPQQTFVEPKTEVVSSPSADPFAQLQQLQSLVNTIKDLKPKE